MKKGIKKTECCCKTARHECNLCHFKPVSEYIKPEPKVVNKSFSVVKKLSSKPEPKCKEECVKDCVLDMVDKNHKHYHECKKCYPEPQSPSWEERLENIFIEDQTWGSIVGEIKVFISQLLSQEQQIWKERLKEKIEKMNEVYFSNEDRNHTEANGFAKAIDDILLLLK